MVLRVHRCVNHLQVAVCASLLCTVAGFSQTTQGLISGRLVNSVTGTPIAGASVTCASSTSNLAARSARAMPIGYYFLPLLSPGFYRLRVTDPGLPGAGSAGAGTDRSGQNRARFPDAAAERRVGNRPIQQRVPAGIEDHRHVLRAGRGPQQIRIFRSAKRPARGAGIHRVGGDRLGRD